MFKVEESKKLNSNELVSQIVSLYSVRENEVMSSSVREYFEKKVYKRKFLPIEWTTIRFMAEELNKLLVLSKVLKPCELQRKHLLTNDAVKSLVYVSVIILTDKKSEKEVLHFYSKKKGVDVYLKKILPELTSKLQTVSFTIKINDVDEKKIINYKNPWMKNPEHTCRYIEFKKIVSNSFDELYIPSEKTLWSWFNKFYGKNFKGVRKHEYKIEDYILVWKTVLVMKRHSYNLKQYFKESVEVSEWIKNNLWRINKYK
jgi:hypothetical protein